MSTKELLYHVKGNALNMKAPLRICVKSGQIASDLHRPEHVILLEVDISSGS